MGCRADASTGVVTPPKKENFWKHLTTTTSSQCGFCRGDANWEDGSGKATPACLSRGKYDFAYLRVHPYLNQNN